MRRQHGFTLVEMVITVVIVTVLTTIALPSYRTHVVRANRSAAQQFLVSAATAEEQVMSDLRSYVAVSGNTNFPNAATATSAGLNLAVPKTVSDFYDVSVTVAAGTPPTFFVAAIPKSSTMQANDHTLYINSAGQRWLEYGSNSTYDPSAGDIDWSTR